MRIGVVIGDYRKASGGLERASVEWARALRDRGHQVTVFAQRWTLDPEADGGILIRRIRGPRRPRWLRALLFPALATRAVRGERPDALVAFGPSVLEPALLTCPGPHAAWVERARRERPRSSMSWWRSRLNPHHAAVLFWERRVFGAGCFARLLATSPEAREDFLRLFPATRGRTDVLERGINLDEFRFRPDARASLRARWGIPPHAPVVVSVANEVERKGIPTLLAAVRALRTERPELRCVLVGRARFSAVVTPADRGVVVAGSLDDVAGAYSAADVFALPTSFDAWGQVVAESLACGTPVVVSKAAGASCLVRDGNGAVLADWKDGAALAGAIRRLLDAPPEREAVRATVEHLSWDRVVERGERLLAGEAVRT